MGHHYEKESQTPEESAARVNEVYNPDSTLYNSVMTLFYYYSHSLVFFLRFEVSCFFKYFFVCVVFLVLIF